MDADNKEKSVNNLQIMTMRVTGVTVESGGSEKMVCHPLSRKSNSVLVTSEFICFIIETNMILLLNIYYH